MKSSFIAILIVCFSLAVNAQKTTTTVVVPDIPRDTITKKITYVEVIKQTGSKDTLYNRAIHWTNIFFKSPQDVTKVRDSQDGKLEGIYRFKVYNPPLNDGTKTDGGTVSFTFTIEVKENRYRYKITDLNVKGVSYSPLEKWLDKNDPSYKPEWDFYLLQVDQYMKDFTKSLKKGMLEAAKVKDEW